MQTFLDKCNLPSLSETEREELAAEITVKDISETIKSLKNGKTPGPDELNNEFYKKCNNITSPRLQSLYTQVFLEQTLLQTLAESIITLIPKKDKNLEEPGTYTAIALLNTDQKILAKTLARRLSLFIDKCVHSDQTGFIPK